MSKLLDEIRKFQESAFKEIPDKTLESMFQATKELVESDIAKGLKIK